LIGIIEYWLVGIVVPVILASFLHLALFYGVFEFLPGVGKRIKWMNSQ
jgi:hypothetical protein